MLPEDKMASASKRKEDEYLDRTPSSRAFRKEREREKGRLRGKDERLRGPG